MMTFMVWFALVGSLLVLLGGFVSVGKRKAGLAETLVIMSLMVAVYILAKIAFTGAFFL